MYIIYIYIYKYMYIYIYIYIYTFYACLYPVVHGVCFSDLKVRNTDPRKISTSTFVYIYIYV